VNTETIRRVIRRLVQRPQQKADIGPLTSEQ